MDKFPSTTKFIMLQYLHYNGPPATYESDCVASTRYLLVCSASPFEVFSSRHLGMVVVSIPVLEEAQSVAMPLTASADIL
jgi:hypothetical protein